MKKTFKSIASLIICFILLVSLGVNAFAASASYKTTARAASQELVDVTCNYYSLSKDNFSVKNNGTITVYVYVNGSIRAQLAPGKTYTHPKSHAFKDRVQIYATKKATGYQKFTITSTSGVIYNN